MQYIMIRLKSTRKPEGNRRSRIAGTDDAYLLKQKRRT